MIEMLFEIGKSKIALVNLVLDDNMRIVKFVC